MSAATSCSDDDAGIQEPGTAPQLAVADLTGGHFAFLAPLGRGQRNGAFNPRVSPVVEICRLEESGQPNVSAACAEVVLWVGTDDGSTDLRLDVDVKREMYSVVVNLAPLSLPTGLYRVSVGTSRTGSVGTSFGFADIAVAASRNQARALAGADVHPVTNTSSLPIKFRIEEGAFCGGSSSCFEGSVGPDGGVFVTTDESAGVQFEDGAVTGRRTLIIERVTADDVAFCLPTHHPQYEGCYRYRLEPALGPGETFQADVVVGICLDPAAEPFENQLELQKWNEIDPATLTSLPRRDVEFLDCEGFSLTSLEENGTFATLASAGGRFFGAMAAAVLPAPLHAASRSPYGGGLNDFSRIGWVRPLTIHLGTGTGQTACTNQTLATDPHLYVKSAITRTRIADVPVNFSVSADGGSLSPYNATTDVFGYASTRWTFGSVVGKHTLLAAVMNPLTGWPQWTALPAAWGSVGVRATATDCSVE